MPERTFASATAPRAPPQERRVIHFDLGLLMNKQMDNQLRCKEPRFAGMTPVFLGTRLVEHCADMRRRALAQRGQAVSALEARNDPAGCISLRNVHKFACHPRV